MDERGFVYITGRESDMYISGGSNVYPREVEEVILMHPAVLEVAVLGMRLRETTMAPETRSLIRITLPQEFEQRAGVARLVDELMGRNPEHRFNFIQNRAGDVDRDLIDA